MIVAQTPLGNKSLVVSCYSWSQLSMSVIISYYLDQNNCQWLSFQFLSMTVNDSQWSAVWHRQPYPRTGAETFPPLAFSRWRCYSALCRSLCWQPHIFVQPHFKTKNSSSKKAQSAILLAPGFSIRFRYVEMVQPLKFLMSGCKLLQLSHSSYCSKLLKTCQAGGCSHRSPRREWCHHKPVTSPTWSKPALAGQACSQGSAAQNATGGTQSERWPG